MKNLFASLFILTTVAACAAPMDNIEPIPGRISAERERRDHETCKRINRLVTEDTGFLFEISRDCGVARDQILNKNTSLAVFDVARAYLDGLYDYANTTDFLLAQGGEGELASNFGAYLIGQQTGLIGAMKDWRYENGMKPHPELYIPSRQIMV